MRGFELLSRSVTAHGVEVVFGLIGDANLYWVDHFVRDGGGRYVAAAAEAGSVLMATGYARSSGRLGVATVTHGPALTNTATALIEAVRDGTPLVLIAGDTAASDREHLQDIDQRAFVNATGAGFEPVRSVASVSIDLSVAVRRAWVERRPIVLNVPADLQWAETSAEAVAPEPIGTQATAPDLDRLDQAVGIVASARRPIILAGRGATSPAARDALVALAERIGAPVATTLKARDLFRGDPWDLGIFGTLASDVALDAIAASDCVVAFGAALTRRTTVDGALLRSKRVVQCDIDATQLGRLTAVDCGVVGDASRIATSMVAWLDEAGIEPTTFRSSELAARLANSDPPVPASSVGPIDVTSLSNYLERALPTDRTLVFDAGRFCYEPLRLLHVPEPRALHVALNFGSIGLGVATAIGSAIGSPDRTCVVVCGDGGFLLGGLTELDTAVREQLDLVMVICNDGSYGAEYVQFVDRGLDPGLSLFTRPSFAAVATALGAHGVTVNTAADLTLIDTALADPSRRPLLIDVRLDPARMPNRR
ncbi:thiamine pyrophosphate-binding protein [Desertimonas flava]|uniref:thiamine pyrophosphate-binding protein n=1 Tax=Desertimonas flava TaxID=2064846 RepID=UPI000E34ADC7|nr:thiamine pyrophosphate-binding protein [Desertimonas flava]